MLKITSKENPKIKLLRAVRKGINRDYVFVEGAKLCEEALESGLPIYTIFCTPEFAASPKGREFLDKSKGLLQVELTEKLFKTVADTDAPQGIVLLCRRVNQAKDVIERNLNKSKLKLVVLLHKISNPSNLGAILRIVRAVDACGVVLTKGSADPFSAKAVRSSAGACLHLPIWTGISFTDAIEWAREFNLKIVCADARGDILYTENDWKIPTLLIFGSEGQGLADHELQLVDSKVKIPLSNGVESLNVAVACGIILYHASLINIEKMPNRL